MKRQIQQAILWLLVLANASYAGWNSNAWPSDQHHRFTNTSDRGESSTNISVVEDTEIWTITSGTNFIPDLVAGTWPNVTVNPGRPQLPRVNTFVMYREGYYTASPFRLESVPIKGANTNYMSWQKTYYRGPGKYGVNVGGPLYWWGATFDIDGVYQHYLPGGTPGVVTVKVDHVSAVAKNISIPLDVPDLWSWDTHQAIHERCDVLDVAYTDTPRYYKYMRDNLTSAKSWLSSYVPSFIDQRQTNAAGNLGTWFATGAPDFPFWTATGLLSHVDMPTNYFAYTPYRDLGGSGIGQGHIITSSVVLTSAETNLTVSDYCGNDHVITGTNGQLFSFVCTNANVMEGFTTSDYGFKKMDTLINELICISLPISDRIWTNGGFWLGEQSGAETNWAWTQEQAESNYHEVGQSQVGGSIYQVTFQRLEGVKNPPFFDFDPHPHSVIQGDYAHPCFVNIFSSYTHDVDFYVRAIMPDTYHYAWFPFHVDEAVFDVYGLTNLIEDTYVYQDSIRGTSSNTVISTVQIGSTNKPLPWGTNVPLTEANWLHGGKRGYRADFKASCWWNVTNGFSYQ